MDAQWKWLAEQLREPVELRLISSGTQVLPDEHGPERWGHSPRDRKKIFHTIQESQANRVVLLSGDRPMAEVMKLASEEAGVGYPAVRSDFE